jgi:hypothetical protein
VAGFEFFVPLNSKHMNFSHANTVKHKDFTRANPIEYKDSREHKDPRTSLHRVQNRSSQRFLEHLAQWKIALLCPLSYPRRFFAV